MNRINALDFGNISFHLIESVLNITLRYTKISAKHKFKGNQFNLNLRYFLHLVSNLN